MSAKTFTDLIVWQKAHQFVLEIYRATQEYPKQELFGLTSQMRRAAVSIPANIAEGFKRQTIPDKLRYMNIAQSSIEESRYFLILSKDLGYVITDNLMNLIEEVSRLLNAYMKALELE